MKKIKKIKLIVMKKINKTKVVVNSNNKSLKKNLKLKKICTSRH